MHNKTIEYIDLAIKMLNPDANQELIQTLNEYKTTIEKLAAVDEEGKVPKMTPKSVQVLSQSIASGIAATSEYLKGARKSSGLAHTIGELNKSLKSDLKSIRNTINVYDVDVQTLLSSGKENVVNASDFHGTYVGSGFNRRMAIELPNGKKGFFTEAKNSDPEVLYRQTFAAMKNMFPGYDNEFDVILEGYVKASAKSSDISEMAHPIGFTDTEIVANSPEFEEAVKKLNSSEHLQEMMISLKNDFSIIIKSYYEYTDSKGLDKKTRIDSRNVAMSAIADLLGCGDIIARSIPLTVHSANGDIEGTFMEFADGEDYSRLSPDSPLFAATKESYNGPGLRSSVDMAVVDVICDNGDRHIGNCFFKMSPDGNQFKGLIGIDNDDSFGKHTRDSERQWNNMISQINVISEDMANTLSTLNRGKVAAVLSGCNLESEEIDAVMMRVNALNKRIAENQVRIIKNHEWKEMTLDALSNASTSSPIRNVKALSEESKEVLQKNVIIGSKKLIHAQSNYVQAKTDYAAMATRLKTYCTGLEKVNKGLFVGSTQFDNMLKIAKYVQKQYAKMSLEKVPEGMDKEEFNKKQHERSSSMLGLLRDVTSMYIDHKNDDNSLGSSNTARDRVWASMNLRHFLVENTPPEDLPDKDFYRETAYQDRINAYKSISPKELKTRIDNLIKISGNEKMTPTFKREAEQQLSSYVNELKARTGLVKQQAQKAPQLIS